MSMTDLLARAQSAGIDISPKDGQINVSMPWNVNNIPDHVKEILVEIKAHKGELLAYFAMAGPDIDIKIIIAALEAQGVRITPDPDTGFRIYVNPSCKGRHKNTAVKLISKMDSEGTVDRLVEYLSREPPEG